ncbi:MAG: hypothetical protein FWD21_03685 [Peptococcaceae bacterium]|nr:hypothetical protein [Peptococcaceae bacterium]
MKRALGYEYEEIKEEYENGELTKRIVTTKQIAPDVAAIIYWLKNRMPNKWRDKPVADELERISENITALADLLNNPVPERGLPM